MRAFNRHKAQVAGIEPGGTGEVDTDNAGIKVFIEAGLLVDANTISGPEREPTLDEMRAHVADANANALKFNGETVEARSRVAELEAQNKQLAAVAETNASELKKAHDANGKLAARVTELEAQLAAKAESAPAAEPTGTPEAPAKKGKG